MAHDKPVSRQRPAASPQELEDRIGNKAMLLAEKQIDDETVSSQVQVHYLKLMSSRERLEQERLRGEVSLNKIKEETLAAETRIEEKIEKAMQAFRSYLPSIHGGEDEYDDE